MSYAESIVEEAALDYFAGLGYQVLAGPDIAPGTPASERADYRADYRAIVLERRLADALVRLNPTVPRAALDDALRYVTRSVSPSLVVENRAFHKLLVEGVTAGVPRGDGTIAWHRVLLIDIDHPDANDWPVVNQFTVVSGCRAVGRKTGQRPTARVSW